MKVEKKQKTTLRLDDIGLIIGINGETTGVHAGGPGGALDSKVSTEALLCALEKVVDELKIGAGWRKHHGGAHQWSDGADGKESVAISIAPENSEG